MVDTLNPRPAGHLIKQILGRLTDTELHSLARRITVEMRLEASSESLGHHSATVASNLVFFLCGYNLNLVGGKAKELQTAGG